VIQWGQGETPKSFFHCASKLLKLKGFGSNMEEFPLPMGITISLHV
jgi:hypothetical protein